MTDTELLRLALVGVLLLAILAVAYRPKWLPLVAVLAVAVWLPRGQMQRWNVYHYWLNTKYFPELGYFDLYDCTAAAAPDMVGNVPARNLATYQYTAANELPGCTQFTSERLAEFQSDLAWLETHGKGPGIEEAIRDKGLNTTPPWLVVSGIFADSAPGSPLFWLGLHLDTIALAAALLYVAWAVGTMAAAVATISLATWIGTAGYITGHWLQWIWLAALLVAMAAMRRKHYGLAGGMIALAAADRIFPGVLFLWPLLNRRRVPAEFWKAAVAVGVMAVGLGSQTPAGLAIWPEFFSKMAAHSQAIVSEPGVNIGLRNLAVMVSNPQAAWETWLAFGAGIVDGRISTSAPAWTWIPTAVFAALGGVAIWRRPKMLFGDGLLLIFPAVVLSHYYYAWLALNSAEASDNELVELLLINLVTLVLAYYALDFLAAYAVAQLLILFYLYRRMNKCLAYRPASLLAA